MKTKLTALLVFTLLPGIKGFSQSLPEIMVMAIAFIALQQALLLKHRSLPQFLLKEIREWNM